MAESNYDHMLLIAEIYIHIISIQCKKIYVLLFLGNSFQFYFQIPPLLINLFVSESFASSENLNKYEINYLQIMMIS